jgi:hypothetical protein
MLSTDLSPLLTKRRRRSAGLVLAALLFMAGLTGVVWLAAHWSATITGATLSQARADPAALRQFIAHMPRGVVEPASLTEDYVRAAREERLSYAALKKRKRDRLTFTALPDAEKRREIERFDHASKEFEHATAARMSIADGLMLIAGTALSRR